MLILTFIFNDILSFFFRLGGIPVGVIVPEVRPIEKIVPPDPADPSSETKVLFSFSSFFANFGVSYFRPKMSVLFLIKEDSQV